MQVEVYYNGSSNDEDLEAAVLVYGAHLLGYSIIHSATGYLSLVVLEAVMLMEGWVLGT